MQLILNNINIKTLLKAVVITSFFIIFKQTKAIFSKIFI